MHIESCVDGLLNLDICLFFDVDLHRTVLYVVHVSNYCMYSVQCMRRSGQRSSVFVNTHEKQMKVTF